MRKLFFPLILLFLFTGCSSGNTEHDVKITNFENSNYEEVEKSEEFLIEESFTNEEKTSVELEIIFSVVDMEEGKTIESYVAEKNDNGDGTVYYVYDSTHYATMIEDSERIEFLSYIYTEKGENEFLSNFSSSYPDVYTKMEIKNSGKELIFYSTKDKYSSSDFGLNLLTLYAGCSLQEHIQAYEMIPIDEREYSIKIIDIETNELIDEM